MLVKDSLSKMIHIIFSTILDEPPAFRSPSPVAKQQGRNGDTMHGGSFDSFDSRPRQMLGSLDSISAEQHVPGSRGAIRGYGVPCADNILLFLVKLIEVSFCSASCTACAVFRACICCTTACRYCRRVCRDLPFVLLAQSWQLSRQNTNRYPRRANYCSTRTRKQWFTCRDSQNLRLFVENRACSESDLLTSTSSGLMLI
jgi:hypothetical protein